MKRLSCLIAIGVTGVVIGAVFSLKMAPLTSPVARETEARVETDAKTKVEAEASDNMIIIPPKVTIIIVSPAPAPVLPSVPMPVPEPKPVAEPVPIPTLRTENVPGVSRNSASLLAFIDAKGWAFTIWWEYGYTRDLGAKTLESFVTNLPPGLIQKELWGLKSNTIYFYRVSIQMVDGRTHHGEIRSFMTDP